MEREREREIETSIFKILIQTRNLIPLDIPIYIYRSTLVDLVVKYGANISTPFRLLVVNPDPGLFSFSFYSGENEIPPPSMTFRRKESDHPLPTIPFPSSSHFSSPIHHSDSSKFRSLLFSSLLASLGSATASGQILFPVEFKTLRNIRIYFTAALTLETSGKHGG